MLDVCCLSRQHFYSQIKAIYWAQIYDQNNLEKPQRSLAYFFLLNSQVYRKFPQSDKLPTLVYDKKRLHSLLKHEACVLFDQQNGNIRFSKAGAQRNYAIVIECRIQKLQLKHVDSKTNPNLSSFIRKHT